MKKILILFSIFSCFTLVTSAQTVFYNSNFETSTIDGWSQSSTDDFDWTRRSGGTPSGGTGPYSASNGSYYMYAEMSNPRGYGDIAILTSPAIDLSSHTSNSLTFDYHMYSSGYSSEVGDLEVEINVNGTGWSTVIFTRSGSQNSSQSNWLTGTVNLSAYDGDSIQIRFIATRANSWRGDIAFDNVEISGFIANVAEIDITGLGNSISNGDNTPSATDDTDFGSVGSGFSVDHTFTIYNTGNNTTTLNLLGTPIVDISGSSDFSIQTQPSSNSIIGGNSLTFVVRYSPSSNGTVFATISITNTDSNEDPYNFSIQGTGVVPLTAGPGGITTDLQLWLKANDGLYLTDGQSVNSWLDQGRGSNATTNLPAQAPTFRDNSSDNVNFNPVVQFSNSFNTYTVDSDYSYDNTSTQFLQGTSGLYTQDIFLVLIPDDTPITNNFGFMDAFCGDSDISTNSTDATGIGFGYYTSRIDGEIICFALDTFTESEAGDGYAVSEIGTGSSYDNIGIINARNNSSETQQELYYNANDIETDQNDVAEFMNVNDAKFWLGRSEGWEASLNARVVEVITFSSRQDDSSERKKIESYLAIKYGITLGVNGTSQDYVDSNGSLIWDISANSGYNYDIAGIGKDNDSELNQKQSKSVNSSSIVTIGLGEIATTNNLNLNTFATDRDFLVWGRNNDSFNTSSEVVQTVNLSGTTTQFTKVSREWKIIESQNDVAEVILSIPTSVLTSNIPLAANEEYTLVVADDPSFGNNNIIDVIPLVTNGSNSEIWYDFDGTRYFSFAKATRNIAKRQINFSSNEFLIGDNQLELNSNFTVSTWVLNNGNGGSFISKETSYNFKVNASDFIEIDWNGSTRITSNNSISNGIWHHIALTFNAGSANLYIDGVLDKTVNSLPNPVSSSSKFSIGALYTNKNNISSFDGSVDEVRIWNSNLTVDEIRYIMNQEIEIYGANVNGEIIPQTVTKNDISSRTWSELEAYFDMNSFYGTTVEDNSNNNHWARIKYLTKDKQVVESQTAPLPYQSQNNGDWDTANTWLNNSVQYLPNTTLNSTTIDWNIVEVNSNVDANRGITLLGLKSNSNELSIEADNHLTISHYFLLNGVVDLVGESQLIQTTDSDFDEASTGYLERDQQGIGNRYRYNDWSSPVTKIGSGNNNTTPFTIADVFKDGTDENNPAAITFVSGYDGAIGSPLEISEYWMYKFADSPDGDYSSWQQIGSTGNLVAGEGFLMKGPGDPSSPDQNYVFVGKPNNGDITLAVSGTNDYLVGNPYPSAIDSKQFILDNGPTGTASITGTIYYWEHYGGDSHNLSEYQAGYGTYSLGGAVMASAHPGVSSLGSATKLPQQYLPIGQGFFVQGDADGGLITFKNSQRVFETEASGNSVFMKTTAQSKITTVDDADIRPKYRIGFDGAKIDHRQILLTIDENTTDAVDWGYDAEIFEIFEDDMYWLIDDKKYVIQATNTVSVDKEIPLGIVSSGDLITISIDGLENVSNDITVSLKDKDSGKIYDLTDTPFEVTLPAGEYHSKYVITFKSNETLNVEDLVLNSQLSVFYNKSIKSIIINNIENEIKKVYVYNTLGQVINKWIAPNSYSETLTIPLNVKKGVYFIQVITENYKKSQKIVVN
ncbi:LamG-like jellyroll fold domain-containing protein [Lutibacter sp. TH_r2]|uniref:LamG-like jellyroll fold domain-containing protein n=1 Tax=Lutibacter sp. TH_r2 TaxID=3082083 RepID=UPI00295343C6|nr:LamG-like jellyroll fold domain-containing protein [Lutibacter sp. TH_r2]MDV7186511.1 LamG-like jellyroll fold domain-containing protein [Lutibacter sp. TH_r2]